MEIERIEEELPEDHLYAMVRPWFATGAVLRRLTWKGTKIPRGAKIDGEPIEWTQNGQVVAGGSQAGHYVRLIEFGGDDGQDHEMLIWSAR